MVRHFYQTAPTKRKFALGIDEEPALKRRGKKPEEEEKDRDSSSGEENLHNVLDSLLLRHLPPLDVGFLVYSKRELSLGWSRLIEIVDNFFQADGGFCGR